MNQSSPSPSMIWGSEQYAHSKTTRERATQRELSKTQLLLEHRFQKPERR